MSMTDIVCFFFFLVQNNVKEKNNLSAIAFASDDIDNFMFGNLLLPLLMKTAVDNNITSNKVPVYRNRIYDLNVGYVP